MKYGKKCFICKKRNMAIYHPPKPIQNNQAPVIAADLAYEGHGKCGNTRILSSMKGEDSEADQIIFDAAAEGNGNAWRMDVIATGIKTNPNKNCPCTFVGGIRGFTANNISDLDASALVNLPIHQPFSIMADITYVQLDVSVPYLVVVLYMDCKQS